jgi:hypothetical protein
LEAGVDSQNPIYNLWMSLINSVKSLPVSDWIDSLIDPSGLLTHFSPSLSFMGGVGKQYVTKTWTSETFLKGERVSVGGDALRTSHCTSDKVATSHRLKLGGT